MESGECATWVREHDFDCVRLTDRGFGAGSTAKGAEEVKETLAGPDLYLSCIAAQQSARRRRRGPRGGIGATAAGDSDLAGGGLSGRYLRQWGTGQETGGSTHVFVARPGNV